MFSIVYYDRIDRLKLKMGSRDPGIPDPWDPGSALRKRTIPDRTSREPLQAVIGSVTGPLEGLDEKKFGSISSGAFKKKYKK